MIMERKEAVIKVENNVNVGSSHFTDRRHHHHHVQSGFPLIDPLSDQVLIEKSGGSSLGFMELLGLQDFGGPSLFDTVQLPYSTVQLMGPPSDPSPEGSALVSNSNKKQQQQQQPGTPNSSSMSSASSEALNDDVPVTKAVDGEGEDGEVEGGQEEEEKKTKKGLKPKKTNQKRQREPRFAFMTKSEVDHLEDGYRWRKYGQKAVKNSPYPRSYYRCTTASCNVKKRVERSFTDPSIVVTTYEGQHTHPSPVMIRPSFTGLGPNSGFSPSSAFGLPMQMKPTFYQHQPFLNNLSPLGGFSHNGSTSSANFLLQDRLLRSTQGSGLLMDHGLLQDIVPSHMFKDE